MNTVEDPMNTVEERLRAALTAKSDAVHLLDAPELDAPELDAPELDAPETVLTLPAELHSRRRWPAVIAGIAAAAMLVAIGVTVHRGGRSSTAGAAKVGSRADVPWSQVGPDWTLVQSNPQFSQQPGPDGLYLIDPSGQHRYLIRSLAGTGWLLSSWSSSTGQALFVNLTNDSTTRLVELNPRTLAQRVLTVPGAYESAQYVGTSRLVLSNGSSGLLFIDPDGRNPVTAPASIGAAGSLERISPVSTADGRYVAVGADNGVGVLRPDGTAVRAVKAPAGYTLCRTTGAWSATEVRAICIRTGHPGLGNTIVFPVDGSSPARALGPVANPSWEFWNLKTGSYGFIADDGGTGLLSGRFGLLGRDGRVTAVAIPPVLKGATWRVIDAEGSNVVIRFWTDAFQRQGMLHFDPSTGAQTVLFQPGELGGSKIAVAPFGFAPELPS